MLSIKLKGNTDAVSVLLSVACVIIGLVAGQELNEQTPSGGFFPRNNGPGGNCEEIQREGPLQQYLQPNDIDNGEYDEPRPDMPQLCARKCSENEPGKICYWRFEVDRYSTMGLACKDCPNNKRDCSLPHCVTGDGYEKMIITVNHRMPGPSIQVCQNDMIIVDVKNMMPGTGVTIHWHGITQLGTPYMDGVPMLTQCPIMENQVFRYYFQPSNPGLFFWHSHEGLQKVDGFVGSLIVRRPESQEPYGNLYDFDLPSHVILIQDWMHETGDALFPGLKRRRNGQHPDSFLINGRGRYNNPDGTMAVNTPLSILKIKRDLSYVFRIIGGTCLTCPVRIQIEDHTMTIIGTDGRDSEPRVVDSITMGAGERYRVIVHGKQNPEKWGYWIHVNSTGSCLDDNITGSAVLRYTDVNPNTELRPLQRALAPVVTFGEVNQRCDGSQRNALCYKDLQGVEPAPIGVKQRRATFRLIVGLEFYLFNNDTSEAFPENRYPENRFEMVINPIGNTPVASFINGIVNTMPPVPMLSQYYEVPECLLCSSNNPFSRWLQYKKCLHVYRVDYPSVVEIIVLDLGTRGHDPVGMSHPIHLHGYDQYLIDQGVFASRNNVRNELTRLMSRLDNGEIRIPDKPLMKDTFMVPNGGYIVLRVIADNPGFWFMHCHFAYHQDSGMSAVLQVGTPDDHPDPPNDFPTCHNFLTMPDGVDDN